MPVAPLIAMKGSQVESLEAIGRELDRRAHTYVNDVADEHRHIGYRCRTEDEYAMPLDKAVERRMGELHTKRKIRDNQVRAMGFIVSSNGALDEGTAKDFLDDAVQWFGARYGFENLLAAQIHLDEGTPHAHIWVAPVIHDAETGYDRLCAKELFAPDKRRKNAEGKWEVTAQGTMSRLQEDFWEQVAKPYGYERPLRREQRAKGYKSLDAYKVHVGTSRALRADLTALETEKQAKELEAEKAAQKAAQAARDAESAEQAASAKRDELRELEGLRVQTRGDLGALLGKCAEKQAQAADLSREIEKKTAVRDGLKAEIADFSAKRDAAADRLESVRRELGEVESVAAASLPELVKQAAGGDDGERERAAAAENRELRAKLAALEEERAGLGERESAARSRNSELGTRRERVLARLGGLRGRIDDAWADLVAIAERVRGYVFEQVGALKWVFDALGIESHEGLAPIETSEYGFYDEVADARAAARSSARGYDDVAQETNRRSWGIGR